jgi:S-formylglutathione hydrolase FrmB
MALLRIDHVPETVKVNLPLNLIIPDPGRMGSVPVAGRKVLYLLHGLSDDGSAWQRFTAIETIAGLYGLVVVMPSAGRSFYTDQPNGQGYFTYLTDELPRYLKQVFGLSPRREDTLIAGNSMAVTALSKLPSIIPSYIQLPQVYRECFPWRLFMPIQTTHAGRSLSSCLETWKN